MTVPTTTEPYDYRAFWRNPPPGTLGPWDPAKPDDSPLHTAQEQAILRILSQTAVNLDKIQSIFEIGCGFGRIARFCAQNMPNARYVAIDLNPAAIDSAQTFQPHGLYFIGDFLELNVEGFYEDPDFSGFDLVIASEVFMHIPPDRLDDAISRALTLVDPFGGYLLTVDWSPLPEDLQRIKRRKAGIAPWNFVHDYARAFPAQATIVNAHRTGQQKVYLMRP